MKKTYAYAVMDGNEAPDQYRFAQSVHHTLDAARKEASRANRSNPNNHYYVIAWEDTRWARVRPAPEHEDGL